MVSVLVKLPSAEKMLELNFSFSQGDRLKKS
jgi:hypothetical protein